MANFGVQATELSGPSGAGSAPVQAVRPPSRSFDMSWLGGVAQVAGAFADREPKQTRADMASDEYSTGLNNINQLATTGDISATESNRRRRELWSTVQTKYSDVSAVELQDRFAKQFKNAADASGISEEVDRAKEMRKREDDLVFEGVKLGIYTAEFASNPELRDMSLDLMQTYYAQERELKVTTDAVKRIEERKKSGREDVTWEQGQTQHKAQQAAKEFFQKTSSKYGDVLGATTNELVEKVRAGTITGEEAIFQLRSQTDKFRGQANAALTYDQPAQTRLNQYLDSIVENAQFQMDPRNITSFTKSRNELAIAQRTAALTSGEDYLTTLSAFRGLVGETAFTQVASLEVSTQLQRSLATVAKTGNTTLVQEGNKEVQKITFGSLNKATDAIKAGTYPNPEEGLADVEKHTKAIIKDLGRIREGDQVKLTETINFMAGPTVKNLIEAGRLPASEMTEAGEVYKALYRTEVMASISQMLNARVERGPFQGRAGGTVNIAEVVDFEVSDDGVVTVVPRWDDKDFNRSSASQIRAGTEIQDINRQLKSLNSIIKVGAHMEGRTDYKKYFEDNASVFLPTFMPDQKFIDEQAKAGYKYLGGNRYNPRNWVKTGGDNGGTVED